MKMSKASVNKRREDIMKLIQNKGKISIDELTNKFSVSELTIRRDLQYWEDRGAIQRYYGGARLLQAFVDTNDDIESNEPYKHAIAKYAASFVEEGDTIFINTSSTALLLLKYIHDKRVTVITNNAKAILINYDPHINVVLTGGEIRNPKESMVGDFAINNLKGVTATKTFLGCSGFDIEGGMTTAILPEVSINAMMVSHCSGPLFMLADATKIGNVHQFKVTNISTFDTLITDKRVLKTDIHDIEKEGVKVITLDSLYGYQQ